MIVVDTSALISIIRNEECADLCSTCLAEGGDLLMSAGTLTESLIVASAGGKRAEIEQLVEGLPIEIVPVTASFAQQCADAYEVWGKGRHPAGLNFGDCFAYVLAKRRNCPLLYVGNDFAQTDIQPALIFQH